MIQTHDIRDATPRGARLPTRSGTRDHYGGKTREKVIEPAIGQTRKIPGHKVMLLLSHMFC
jgi:hypothetical protein